MIHPAHSQLVKVVKDWFHAPFEEMGYRAEKRRWGTYWNTGDVYTLGFPSDEVAAFLSDLGKYYGHRTVYIYIDTKQADRKLGPALRQAGCSTKMTEVFLAHLGGVPEFSTIQDMEIENVGESNLKELVSTRIQAFENTEERPLDESIDQEVAQRKAELAGKGRGMIARIGGEPAAVIWWYEDPKDILIMFLGTRIPFQKQGVATYLLSQLLTDLRGQGKRSVIILVGTDNVAAIRLYRRLGFADEIHWRRQYQVEVQSAAKWEAE